MKFEERMSQWSFVW